jgi:branched-chain amino acid transport system permease protein
MALLLAAFELNWPWTAEVLVGIALYGTLAASLNLVTGYAGMFSLGHHGFFAVGAYAAGWFVSLFALPQAGSAGGWALFLASGGVAVVAAALAGLLVGIPCLRLRGDYLAIATLAFGEIVRITIQNTPALGGSLELSVPRLLMRPQGLAEVAAFRDRFLVVGAVLLLVTLVVLRNLVRSAHGRAVVSIREDEVASDLLGVPTTRYKILAFVLGSAFAGAAGWFYAHYNGSIAPANFDLLVGIKILVIVVLGGMGSLRGTVLAAAALVGMERLLLTGLLGEWAKDWMQVLYALLLILLMLMRVGFWPAVRFLTVVVRGARAGGAP